MQKTFKPLIPLLILFFLLLIFFLIANFYFPNPDVLLDTLKRYFAQYGYPVLLISAIIESVPVINIYFPGSSIILLAAAFSHQGSLSIYFVIILTMASFTATYALNYYIGMRGWYHLFSRFGMGDAIERSKKQVEKHGSWWIWISYVHPNIGALTSTAFGILKLDFKLFLVQSTLANIFWSIFWGLVMYFSSDQVIGILTARWLVVAVIASIIIAKVLIGIFKKNKEKGSK